MSGDRAMSLTFSESELGLEISLPVRVQGPSRGIPHWQCQVAALVAQFSAPLEFGSGGLAGVMPAPAQRSQSLPSDPLYEP